LDGRRRDFLDRRLDRSAARSIRASIDQRLATWIIGCAG
jgi:hypothetical protein